MIFSFSMAVLNIKGRSFLGFEVEVKSADLEEIEMFTQTTHFPPLFLKDAPVILKFDEKSLSIAQSLIDKLKRKGLNVVAYEADKKIKEELSIPSIDTNSILLSRPSEKESVTWRQNIRSGQTIRADENIVILGNVNTNAYIIAAGDIYVLGKLYGIPHAGCKGDKSAIVFAFELLSPQVRIANVISRAPDEGAFLEKKNGKPEIAYIEKEVIAIKPYMDWLDAGYK
jgi:septum site-determining protein MinC